MLDISNLKLELEEAGAFEKCEARTWVKVVFLLSGFGLLTWGAAVLPLAATALLLLVSLLFLVPAVMLGHEGGHGSISNSDFRNSLALYLLFPVMAGKGAQYWRHKHNVGHHEHPNIMDSDPDLNLWPMASNATAYRKSPKIQQWFQRNLQGWALWPLTLGLVWSMRYESFAHLARDAWHGRITRGWWVDVFSLFLHYVVWVVIPIYFLGPLSIAYYVVVWSLVGPIIATIFGPAHMNLPIGTQAPADNLRLQLLVTRNINLPGILPYMYIGLGNQIEHHLFPKIPHQRMHIAIPIVQRWAAANDVPYQTIDWATGWLDMTRYIRDAWQLETVVLEPASSPVTINRAEPDNEIAEADEAEQRITTGAV
jgi:fatty acid desaturase